MSDFADEPAARGLILLGRLQGLSDSLAMVKQRLTAAETTGGGEVVKTALNEILAWHHDAVAEARTEIALLDVGDW